LKTSALKKDYGRGAAQADYSRRVSWIFDREGQIGPHPPLHPSESEIVHFKIGRRAVGARSDLRGRIDKDGIDVFPQRRRVHGCPQ
jgi:hypothetical protein